MAEQQAERKNVATMDIGLLPTVLAPILANAHPAVPLPLFLAVSRTCRELLYKDANIWRQNALNRFPALQFTDDVVPLTKLQSIFRELYTEQKLSALAAMVSYNPEHMTTQYLCELRDKYGENDAKLDQLGADIFSYVIEQSPARRRLVAHNVSVDFFTLARRNPGSFLDRLYDAEHAPRSSTTLPPLTLAKERVSILADFMPSLMGLMTKEMRLYRKLYAKLVLGDATFAVDKKYDYLKQSTKWKEISDGLMSRACRIGQAYLVQALIQFGCEVTVEHIRITLFSQNPSVLKILLTHRNAVARPLTQDDVTSLLPVAAYQCSWDLLELIANDPYGASWVNFRENSTLHLLKIAMESGNEPVVGKFLQCFEQDPDKSKKAKEITYLYMLLCDTLGQALAVRLKPYFEPYCTPLIWLNPKAMPLWRLCKQHVRKDGLYSENILQWIRGVVDKTSEVDVRKAFLQHRDADNNIEIQLLAAQVLLAIDDKHTKNAFLLWENCIFCMQNIIDQTIDGSKKQKAVLQKYRFVFVDVLENLLSASVRLNEARFDKELQLLVSRLVKHIKDSRANTSLLLLCLAVLIKKIPNDICLYAPKIDKDGYDMRHRSIKHLAEEVRSANVENEGQAAAFIYRKLRQYCHYDAQNNFFTQFLVRMSSSRLRQMLSVLEKPQRTFDVPFKTAQDVDAFFKELNTVMPDVIEYGETSINTAYSELSRLYSLACILFCENSPFLMQNGSVAEEPSSVSDAAPRPR